MSQHRIYRSHRRPRGRWTTLDWAASLSISAFWHLLVLVVLALAVHPFQLPDLNRAVDLELLPPLIPPSMPTVEVQLKPRQERPATPPAPRALPQLRPATPEPPPQAQEAPPQPAPPEPAPPEPQPLEQARPTAPALASPLEVQKRSAQTRRLQTQQALPKFQDLPPEPVTVTRPGAALAPPIEAPRAEAPRRAGSLDTSRAAPQLAPPAPATSAAPAESEAVTTAPPVLTNNNVIQAPVEIRPREPVRVAPGLTTQGGAPQITGPAPGGQVGVPGEPGAPAAGGRPGASRLPPGTLEGFRNAPVLGGLRGFGCEDPNDHKLTTEERNACLDKFARRARQGPDLGLNIPARKQAEYDHDVACHKAYTLAGIPGSAEASRGTSIPGMGSGPTLKECGPGER